MRKRKHIRPDDPTPAEEAAFNAEAEAALARLQEFMQRDPADVIVMLAALSIGLRDGMVAVLRHDRQTTANDFFEVLEQIGNHLWAESARRAGMLVRR